MQDSGPQRSWGASWWRGAWRGTGRVSLKRKPAQMGLLRDQQRDTHPGGGTAFCLGLWNQGLVQGWRLFSPVRRDCSLTVRSGGVQIQQEKLCCTCAGGKRKDVETTETLTVRSLPGTVRGSGGDADKQNGLLGPVTTAT